MSLETENCKMESRLKELELAIRDKNKKRIFACYDEINFMDFASLLNVHLDRYDQLVDKGNNILYDRLQRKEEK